MQSINHFLVRYVECNDCRMRGTESVYFWDGMRPGIQMPRDTVRFLPWFAALLNARCSIFSDFLPHRPTFRGSKALALIPFSRYTVTVACTCAEIWNIEILQMRRGWSGEKSENRLDGIPYFSQKEGLCSVRREERCKGWGDRVQDLSHPHKTSPVR